MSASRIWIAAATVGAVEALKDQGFCRWNYAIRSIHRNARNSVIRSFSEQAKNKPSSSNGRLQEFEESLKEIMCVSFWGPN